MDALLNLFKIASMTSPEGTCSGVFVHPFKDFLTSLTEIQSTAIAPIIKVIISEPSIFFKASSGKGFMQQQAVGDNA